MDAILAGQRAAEHFGRRLSFADEHRYELASVRWVVDDPTRRPAAGSMPSAAEWADRHALGERTLDL